MPKRTDIQTILIIGSGPIIIGQACEFDYSGTQACKALKEEGYRIILVNSNPATIMTDPEFSDATYIEPLTVEILEKIIAKERPDALLPTLGGQTGLNLAVDLNKAGVLQKYSVRLIGADLDAIERGENREIFRRIMGEIGLDVAKSEIVHNMEDAAKAVDSIGSYPLIIRPSFTLGGAGGGIAYNKDEYETIVRRGLELSPTTEVLVEECLLGWKEYEMEVMRDNKDQCVVICSIENIDPMGVHTGDSITVAPTITLTDKQYQLMRDASFAVIRAIGVETGGSNIQFAVDPQTGRMVVIEMNPRVSRSSALASKATGFPIAKIAAKLAVGYALDELKNDITQQTLACFEPSIDYIVTKIPRFAFEKFLGSSKGLTSAMKSVGEVMAIGRTFQESFQKALRSLEIGANGFGAGGRWGDDDLPAKTKIITELSKPTSHRIFYVRYALMAGLSIQEIHEYSKIDPWFLAQMQEITDLEKTLKEQELETLSPELMRQAKEAGFTDIQIAYCLGTKIRNIQKLRKEHGIKTHYQLVDTCAGEFEASTPYYYSSYGQVNEIRPSNKKKIMIIGGGPNRIGQGIEFDYCCVHASFALREMGYETVMINSNPETVSTDYDTSDKLYFEPLIQEDVLEVYNQEKCDGAIVQLGGQTSLNLASALKANGVNILGTSPESIELAEDRKHFKDVLDKLGLKQPQNATALTAEEVYAHAGVIGFPILLRPSFVLGGRGMFIVYEMEQLKKVIREVFDVAPGKPVLIDKFLEDATEIDVDCISDGETTVIGGMLEHVEYAGIHSGDATMVMPTQTLRPGMLQAIRRATYELAKELDVVGLMNIQFAIKDHSLYILEVNPRASRTVPFISKAIGHPLAKYAARVMAGDTLKSIGFTEEVPIHGYAVKAAVFPFVRFGGATITLGPEMRSTGEVMGIDKDLGIAYAKSQMAAKPALPSSGNVFLSVKDSDKPEALGIARELYDMGFKIYSSHGTANYLQQNGIPSKKLFKIFEGGRPNVADYIRNDEMELIINTPLGLIPHEDENAMRELALQHGVCMIITMMGAHAAVDGIRALKEKQLDVAPLQYYTANNLKKACRVSQG